VFPKLGDLPFSSFSFYFSLSCYIWARGGQIPSDERNVGAGVTALFPCSEQCGVSTKLSLSTKPPPVRVPLNLAPCLMHRHGPCRRWLCPCGRHWRLRFRCRCPCSHFRLRLCHCHCLCARCCPTRVAAIASATIVVAAVSPGSIFGCCRCFRRHPWVRLRRRCRRLRFRFCCRFVCRPAVSSSLPLSRLRRCLERACTC